MAITEPHAGRRIGEYILEEMIGQGAFAQVWRARHHILNDKAVAFKIPINGDYLRNLRKEATIQHHLVHPNIVRTLGLDPWHDPPYLMMEYVDGKSLRDLLNQKKRLPHTEAVRITCAVLEALDAAHKRNVIHRDIKPENILLGGDGAVKVSDFGLGLASEAASLSLSISLASTEEARKIVGTLDYMAPEQRHAGEATPQSDLYSVGAVLYEMLTGALPLGRFRLPSEVDSTAPAWLDDVIGQCLDPEPSGRPRSAATLLSSLRGSTGAEEEPVAGPSKAPSGDGMDVPTQPPTVLDKEAVLLLELAEYDFRNSRPKDALARLIQAQRFPDGIQGALALAQQFAKQMERRGRFDLAVDFYDIIVIHEPDDVAVLVAQASAAIEAGLKEKALATLGRVLSVDPANKTARALHHRATSRMFWLPLNIRGLLTRHAAILIGLVVLFLVFVPLKPVLAGFETDYAYRYAPAAFALLAAVASWPGKRGASLGLGFAFAAQWGAVATRILSESKIVVLPFFFYSLGVYLLFGIGVYVVRAWLRRRCHYRATKEMSWVRSMLFK